jgi:hypothetical protein
MEVDLICRQTNYTEEEAQAKLTEWGDPVKVIQEYMGVLPKEKKMKNTNQLIFQEITKFVEEVHARKVNSSFSGTGGTSPPASSTPAARTPGCSE